MSDGESRIDRRTALKGAGVAGAALATGGLGLAATTGGAMAVGSQTLGPVTIESDDGSVEYVAIHGDSVVEWSGFDTPATHFDIAITLDVLQGGDSVDGSLPQEIHSTGEVDLSNTNWGGANEALSGPGTSGTIESAVGLAGDGTHDPTIDWHVVGTDPDGYGLPSNPVDASHLSVGTDGASEDYTLRMASTYTWYDGSGGPEIFSETFETDIGVTVDNLPATSTVSSGDGTDGATGA